MIIKEKEKKKQFRTTEFVDKVRTWVMTRWQVEANSVCNRASYFYQRQRDLITYDTLELRLHSYKTGKQTSFVR